MLPGRSTIWCLIKSSQSFRFILCFWLSPPGQTEPESVEGGLVWSQLVYVYLEKLLWSEDGRETCFTVSGRSSSIQCIITILLSATSLTAQSSLLFHSLLTSHISTLGNLHHLYSFILFICRLNGPLTITFYVKYSLQ